MGQDDVWASTPVLSLRTDLAMSENVIKLAGKDHVPLQEPFLTRKQVAEHFQWHVHTVDRFKAEGLPAHRWGMRSTRYRLSEVLGWLEDRERKAA